MAGVSKGVAYYPYMELRFVTARQPPQPSWGRRGCGLVKRLGKILTLKEYGVFRDFTWPSELPAFGDFNIIYGWNGSGKTLLSKLFSAIQSGTDPECGDVQIELSSGEAFHLNDFGRLREEIRVRVFNCEFAEREVYKAEGAVRPIFVIGEKSIKLQKELEFVREEIQNLELNLQEKERALRQLNRELDNKMSEGARSITQTLNIPGRAFEARHFRQRVETLLEQTNVDSYIVSEEIWQILWTQYTAERRDKISELSYSFQEAQALVERARDLCGRSVVANVIEQLTSLSDVNVWVEKGLALHKRHGSTRCFFCDQPLTTERLEALEAHFSSEYAVVIEEIETLIGQCETIIRNIDSWDLPSPGELYQDLRAKYDQVVTALLNYRKRLIDLLSQVLEALKEKRNNPFNRPKTDVPDMSLGDDAIAAVNEVIREHNRRVENHEHMIREAREKLLMHMVAEKLPEIRQLKMQRRKLEEEIGNLRSELAGLRDNEGKLVSMIVDYRRPAEELNREIWAYLGHNELRFEVEETGYQIVRGSEVATGLSEGEQTAIALLYFLKSLDDADFDLQNGIVVIDDPVSSLDSNALHYAFGFIRDRLGSVGQLFILTHNYVFCRQVMNWFDHLEKRQRRNVQYYMLEVVPGKSGRSSRLVRMDPAFQQFESEYHYLFSLVYKAAQSPVEISQYSYLPNVVRRLLEGFLAFKVPGKKSLYHRLKELGCDWAIANGIQRFCDSQSHHTAMLDGEQDLDILSQCPKICQDVLRLIEQADPEHYERMVSLVSAGT